MRAYRFTDADSIEGASTESNVNGRVNGVLISQIETRERSSCFSSVLPNV